MTRDTLTKLIEKSQAHDVNEPRDYIGASIIGSDCLRQIWYEFKGTIAEGVPTKTRRTWDIGKCLEGLILEWIKSSGVRVYGSPVKVFSKNVLSLQGHLDGMIMIDDLVYFLEIKTAKDSSFKIFINKGLKIWNPQYYAQIQAYMGMGNIPYAYIIVLNKDNSDLSDELITFDPEFYASLERKALMISTSVIAPPKINGSPLFYKCKMCKFNKVCHK